MTKIYIVFYSDPYSHGEDCDCQCMVEDRELRKAFTTEKKAKEYVEEQEEVKRERFETNKKYARTRYPIEEIELE
jgi:hypothetical protein